MKPDEFKHELRLLMQKATDGGLPPDRIIAILEIAKLAMVRSIQDEIIKELPPDKDSQSN